MASKGSIQAGQGHVTLGVDDTPLIKGLKAAQAKVQAFGMSLVGIGASVGALGGALAAPLMAGINSFADYEQALADLRAASNPSAEQFERIKSKIEELSLATGSSAVEVTQAFSELLKAGAPLETVLGGLGEATIKFARVSGMGMAETAVVLSDALNVFGHQGISAAQAANIMNQAADASTISLKDVADSFAQGGSVAALFNQSMLDTATAIGIMGNAGIKGAQAGTALKTFLTRIATGVAENGTDEVAVAMRRLGLNVRDANGQMLALPEILDRIQAGLAGLSQAEQDQTLKQLAGMRGILGLAPLLRAGAQGFRDFQGVMSSALPVEEKFAIMTDTLKEALKKLWNQVQWLSITVGAALAPSFKKVLQAILPILTAAKMWFSENNRLIAGLDTASAVIIIVGAVISGLGVVVYASSFILAAFTGGIIALTYALAFIGAGLIVFGLIYFALSKLDLTIGDVRDAWMSIWADMSSVFGPFLNQLAEIGTTFTAMYYGILAALGAGEFSLAWKVMTTGAALAWLQFTTAIMAPWNNLVASLSRGIVVVQTLWGQFTEAMKGWFQLAAISVKEAFDIVIANALMNINIELIRIAGMVNPLQDTEGLIEAERNRGANTINTIATNAARLREISHAGTQGRIDAVGAGGNAQIAAINANLAAANNPDGRALADARADFALANLDVQTAQVQAEIWEELMRGMTLDPSGDALNRTAGGGSEGGQQGQSRNDAVGTFSHAALAGMTGGNPVREAIAEGNAVLRDIRGAMQGVEQILGNAGGLVFT